MKDEHKAALAQGREARRAVRAYLEGLEQRRPTRGRKPSRESIERRLALVNDSISTTDPLKRVALIQERIDLEGRLAAIDGEVDLDALEGGFVQHAASYSERKGITYAAWREAGVSPAVLKAAGVGR